MNRTAFGWVAVLFAFLAGAAQAPHLSPARAEVVSSVTVRAHRGGIHANLIENTALNYRAAAAEGRLAWEGDIRFTSSNIPMMLHDSTLALFGCPTKSIATTTVTGARACVAPNGQTVSTLYEMLVEMKAAGANAWVELKTNPTSVQWVELDSRLAPYKDRIVIESFLAPALLAATTRGYSTALLSTTAVLPSTLPAGTDWFAPTWTAITATQVTAMHTAGYKVTAWTVNTLDRPKVAAGVDEIISNDAVVPTQ